jgi:tetratricopeptide (TPR) repeat protein
MIELYEKKRMYQDVIKLADKVLSRVDILDANIEREIRYWLCLSLARIQDRRFLEEVQKIPSPDHNYLLGFYYRLQGRNAEAMERLQDALNEYPNFYRAKRELVQVYLNIEDYDSAFELAKDNYEHDKNNPYQIQGFLRCLLADNIHDHRIVYIRNLQRSRFAVSTKIFLQCPKLLIWFATP